MPNKFDRVAPILPVRQMRKALEHYRGLGFTTQAYAESEGSDPVYGFAQRGAIDLHLARVPDLRTDQNCSACYLYVDNADELYEEWNAAALGGRLSAPANTAYGLRGFAYTDLDGSLLRVGSPLRT